MNPDPLSTPAPPTDRLFYATGVLLNADDFKAEQLYHRGRLARSLAYLHGRGTIAGLKVEWHPATAATTGDNPQPAKEEEIVVTPGLAIDRLGRLIEVPRSACVRLDRWYESQKPDDLISGLHGDPVNGVLVDVFLRFVACERGKTPAFAAGPFDALDAVTPSRLRDSYELKLVIRTEDTPPVPFNPWAAITPASSLEDLHTAILDSWHDGTDAWDETGNLTPLAEHVPGEDPTAVLLARFTIPGTPGADETRPIRTDGAAIAPNNQIRPFVYPSGLLAQWKG
jgi:hypothetical protein